MTQEKFEQACEIQTSINTIMELQDLLANSQGNGFGKKYLAAIDVESFDQSGYVVESCDVLNHISVPHRIMKLFNDILQTELSTLEKEFEEL